MSTVTPSSLIRRSSWRISQLIRGSRLPVGSSAMTMRGSWTSARAIAVRCCSPPESWLGYCWAWAVRPTSLRTPLHGRTDPPAGRASHLEGEGDVLADGLRRQELEVLEDDADLAPHHGHLPARQAGKVVAVEDHVAHRGQLVPDQELHQGRLAGAGCADEEDEVALRDDEVDVLQGVAAVRIGLGHVVEHEHRPARVGRRAPVAARGIDAGPAWLVGRRIESLRRALEDQHRLHDRLATAGPRSQARRREPRRGDSATRFQNATSGPIR